MTSKLVISVLAVALLSCVANSERQLKVDSASSFGTAVASSPYQASANTNSYASSSPFGSDAGSSAQATGTNAFGYTGTQATYGGNSAYSQGLGFADSPHSASVNTDSYSSANMFGAQGDSDVDASGSNVHTYTDSYSTGGGNCNGPSCDPKPPCTGHDCDYTYTIHLEHPDEVKPKEVKPKEVKPKEVEPKKTDPIIIPTPTRLQPQYSPSNFEFDLESAIRQAIIDRRPRDIADLIYKYSDLKKMGKGFVFEGPLESLLVETSDRVNDLDIIAFKGLSYGAVIYGMQRKLADVTLYSLFTNELVTYDKFGDGHYQHYVLRKLTESELAEMRSDLISDFNDLAYMQSIIDNTYFNSNNISSGSYTNHRGLLSRMLLLAQGTTAPSSVCYNCDPIKTCKKTVSYCADSGN